MRNKIIKKNSFGTKFSHLYFSAFELTQLHSSQGLRIIEMMTWQPLNCGSSQNNADDALAQAAASLRLLFLCASLRCLRHIPSLMPLLCTEVSFLTKTLQPPLQRLLTLSFSLSELSFFFSFNFQHRHFLQPPASCSWYSSSLLSYYYNHTDDAKKRHDGAARLLSQILLHYFAPSSRKMEMVMVWLGLNLRFCRS